MNNAKSHLKKALTIQSLTTPPQLTTQQPIRWFTPTLAAAACLLPLTSAYAQTEHNHERIHQPMEETIVSASPLLKKADAVAAPVAVLSGDALKKQAAATLGDTLANQLGVSTAGFGAGVGQPVIRGQSAGRVRVLQNHIGTLDAATTSPDHANTTETLLADRIEILRGPATLRYGNGAIGGVINVLDSRIPSQSTGASLSGGVEVRHNSGNDENVAVARLDGGNQQWRWHLNGLTRQSNNVDIPGWADADLDAEDNTYGFIENSDTDAEAFTLGGTYFGEQGFIGLSVQRLTNEYGIPPGGHAHGEHEHGEHDHEDEHEGEEHEGEEHHDEHEGEDHHDEHDHEGEEFVRIDMEQTRYDLHAALNTPTDWLERIEWRAGYNDYQHMELEGEDAGTLYDNEAFETRLEATHASYQFLSAEGRGAMGIQWLDRDYAAIGDEAFIPASHIQNLGVFGVQELTWGEWQLEGGLRWEQQRIDTTEHSTVDHESISASLSGNWHFSEHQRIAINLSRAQRAPTVEELFAHGEHLATQQFLIGDTDLDNETSINTELSYHYHGPIRVRINLFNNRVDDYLYAQELHHDEDHDEHEGEEHHDEHMHELGDGHEHDTEFDEYAYTQRDARFSGLEAEVSLPLGDHWEWQIFADQVRARFDHASEEGNRWVPRQPPKRIGTAVHFDTDQWSAELRWTHASSQSRTADDSTVPSYDRVDASLQYQIDWGSQPITVFVQGRNLLDETIRQSTSYLGDSVPEAGRSLQAGVRLSF